MLRRLARAVVRNYPQPWQDRYGSEVLELLDDAPVRFTDLGELVRGLILEHARAMIEDTEHPKRTIAILGLTRFLCVALFIGSAWATGAALRTWSSLQPPDYVGPALGMLWVAVFWPTVLFRLHRRGWTVYPPAPLFSARTGLALLPVLFVVTAVAEWSFVEASYKTVISPSWQYGNNVFRIVFYHGYAAGILSAAFWPRRELLEVLSQMILLDRGIRSAETWVDGCHTMIAKGVPSPLDEAQGNVDRLNAEREKVLARLDGLGYRARFRA